MKSEKKKRKFGNSVWQIMTTSAAGAALAAPGLLLLQLTEQVPPEICGAESHASLNDRTVPSSPSAQSQIDR